MPIDDSQNIIVFNSGKVMSCFVFPLKPHEPFGKEKILKLLHWFGSVPLLSLKRIFKRCLRLLKFLGWSSGYLIAFIFISSID